MMFYGNANVVKRLEDDVQRISGAIMLVGPKGIGKFTVARTTARKLMCLGRGNEDCNCKSCNSIDHHPDLFIMKPNKSIKLEDINEILSKIDYQPSIGRSKVVIIDDANVMTEPAQNRILKKLEEPHSKLKFILINHSSMLETIHSRCSVYKFSDLDDDSILRYLDDQGVVDSIQREFLLVASQGCIGKINELLNLTNFFDDSKSILSEFYVHDDAGINLLRAFHMNKEKSAQKDGFIEVYGHVMESIFTLIQTYLLDLKKIKLGAEHAVRMKTFCKISKCDLSIERLSHLEQVVYDYRKKVGTRHFYRNDLFFMILNCANFLYQEVCYAEGKRYL